MIQRAIDNNLDVKLARFDALIKATELPLREAVFDTILKTGVSYSKDSSKKASILLGTKATGAVLLIGGTLK